MGIEEHREWVWIRPTTTCKDIDDRQDLTKMDKLPEIYISIFKYIGSSTNITNFEKLFANVKNRLKG